MVEEQKRILVVEDQAETAEMFVEMLKLSGYQVWSSPNGQTAIGMIREKMPDAVILDLMMPDIPGMEVLRFVRGLPGGEDTPVIVVSAKSLPKDVREGLEAGATAYLTKPVSYQDLKQAIETALGEE